MAYRSAAVASPRHCLGGFLGGFPTLKTVLAAALVVAPAPTALARSEMKIANPGAAEKEGLQREMEGREGQYRREGQTADRPLADPNPVP